MVEGGGVETIVVLTKADKIPKSKRKLAAHKCKKEMGLSNLPILFLIKCSFQELCSGSYRLLNPICIFGFSLASFFLL